MEGGTRNESFDNEIPSICRMCLSTDCALEPVANNDSGKYLFQKIFAYTSVQMIPSAQFPSYLCSKCKSHLHNVYMFRDECSKNIRMVNRFALDSSNLNESERVLDQADGGVESVSVKTEGAAIDSEHGSEAKTLDSDSKQESTTYDYSERDDLFEAQDQSLGARLKCEPAEDQEHQTHSSAVDQGNWYGTLKAEPLNFNCHVKGEPFVTYSNSETEYKFSETDSSIQGKSGYTDNQYVSVGDEQQSLPSNSEQNIVETETAEATQQDPKVSTNLNYTLKHLCPYCPAKYGGSYECKIHIRTHTGEKPFKCAVCHKSFHASYILAKHSQIHNKDQYHQCPQCPAKFVRCYNLKNHIRTHTGERPFKCEVCNKTFHSSNVLAGHSKIHNKDQHHQCPHCSVTFTQLSQLNIHIRTHTGEKPFKCEVCHKAFHASKILVKHSLIHNKVQQLLCPHCPAKFTRSNSLKIHIRTHTGEKPFKCEVCNKAFHAANILAVHIKFNHKGQHRQCQ